MLDDTVVDAYVAAVTGLVGPPRTGLRIVHTAMHGVGTEIVLRAFAEAGFDPPISVSRQAAPDPRTVEFTLKRPYTPGLLYIGEHPIVAEHRFRSAQHLFGGITVEYRDWVDRYVGPNGDVAFLWEGSSDKFAVWENEVFNRSVGPIYTTGPAVPGVRAFGYPINGAAVGATMCAVKLIQSFQTIRTLFLKAIFNADYLATQSD